ncbi:MAG: NF038130 family PEP-CTERM protein [Planctomycetota bacterium]
MCTASASAQITLPLFSTSGTAIEFCSDGINTFSDGQDGRTCNDSLSTLLSGNSAAPGGNVEIGGNDAESVPFASFPGVGASTLTADFGGTVFTFSSLTYTDWFGVSGGGTSTAFGANNLANQWFADALTAYGPTVRDRALQADANLDTDAEIFAAFAVSGGFQRISDPNLAYVNFDGTTNLTFGLAGNQDAGNVDPIFTGLFASEAVRVTGPGGTQFFYSLSAPTDSAQVNLDGQSHNANFEFVYVVPEPTSLALLGLTGLLVARRKSRSFIV